VTLSMFRYSKD